MLSRHFFRFSYETSILWLFSIGINIRGIHKPKPFWNDESIYLKCNLRIKGRGFTCWSIKAIGLKIGQQPKKIMDAPLPHIINTNVLT